MRPFLLLAAAASVAVATPAAAQSTTSTSARDRIAQILGNLLGYGNNADSSLDGQWTANRRPLGNQRYEFDTRVDAEVRAGRLSSSDGSRLKADYYALVQLEARYGEDRVFTASERSELTGRYNELIRVLTDGNYSGGTGGGFGPRAEVAEGQSEFNARVDAAVQARRITRVAGTRLKADYQALITTEANYLRDGTLSERERADLDERLDTLDQRVGDVGYGGVVSAKTRLDDIARALPTSGLTAAARAQLLVEHGDLVRLEAAYARLNATAEERSYLDSRIANLETRARVRR